jgi:hypothetical protein
MLGCLGESRLLEIAHEDNGNLCRSSDLRGRRGSEASQLQNSGRVLERAMRFGQAPVRAPKLALITPASRRTVADYPVESGMHLQDSWKDAVVAAVATWKVGQRERYNNVTMLQKRSCASEPWTL